MTEHASSQAETPLQALLDEALMLAHQLEATAASTRELARVAAQPTLQPQAAACVEADTQRVQQEVPSGCLKGSLRAW